MSRHMQNLSDDGILAAVSDGRIVACYSGKRWAFTYTASALRYYSRTEYIWVTRHINRLLKQGRLRLINDPNLGPRLAIPVSCCAVCGKPFYLSERKLCADCSGAQI